MAAACHGENLRGADQPLPADQAGDLARLLGRRLRLGEPLIGGRDTLVAPRRPLKTVESYWPYATTLFDYIRRAMLLYAPGSLSDAQVYALTAYLLAEAGIIDSGQAMDAGTLPQVRMPNRDGFVPAWTPPGDPGHTRRR